MSGKSTAETLWSYYKPEESLGAIHNIIQDVPKLDLYQIPMIKNESSTMKVVEDIQEELMSFKNSVRQAVRPSRCCLSFCCKYTKMFGTTEQN